jgi:hypothetical protein
VKDLYLKLRKLSKDTFDEKELILETLRTETINNEEQRNYIEILRQTIESSILKNGLTPFLLSLKSNHPMLYNNETPNIDVLVDLSQIKGESDKYRKELIMAQVLISELKQEVDFMKRTNDEMNVKREKIKESLETGLKELDEAKLQVNILEQEKNHLNENFSDEKLFNQKLKNEIQDVLIINKKIEKELNEQIRKNTELQNQLQNQNLLNNKINELKISFEQLYQNYEKTLKDKTNMEIECNRLNDEIKLKKSELENNRKSFIEKEERFELEKKNLFIENENLRNLNKSGEKQITELFSTIKEKERESKKSEEKLLSTENSLSKYKKILGESESKLENLEKRFKEQNYLISEMKESLENTTRDKEKFYMDLTDLRNQHENVTRENSKLQKQLELNERNYQKLEEQFETLYKNNRHLEDDFLNMKSQLENAIKENHYWKEKYDKDITNKIGEINSLNRDYSNLKRNFEEINSHKSQLENEIETKEKLFINQKEQIRNFGNEIKTLQANLEEYKKKIEKLNLELEKEVKSNYELNTFSNHITIKLEEATKTIQLLSMEKEKVENLRKKVSDEVESLRRSDKENNVKMHSLNSTLNEIKAASQSSDLLLRNMIEKFKGLINNYKPIAVNNENSQHSEENISHDHFFTKNFLFNMKEDNERNIKCVTDIIRNNEDWIRILFNELEIWHEDQKTNMKKLEEYSIKNKSLEENSHRIEILKDEISLNEKKLQIYVKDLEEEKKSLLAEIENIQKIQQKLSSEVKLFKIETENLKEENFTLKDELEQLIKINEELMLEKNEKIGKISNANFQIDALEERIVIVVKEKRYLESLLQRIAKSHPSPEISRIVNEIMNLTDTLSQLERDKIKISDSISHLNESESIAKGPKDSREILQDTNLNTNQTLENSIRREKENLKLLSNEYEKKILQKKEQIRNLENQMRNVELNEKQYQENIYDYEFKIKLLEKDLKASGDELKRLKDRNINTRFEGNINYLADNSRNVGNMQNLSRIKTTEKIVRDDRDSREYFNNNPRNLNGINYDSIEFSYDLKQNDNLDDLNLDNLPSKDVERLDRIERVKLNVDRDRQINSFSYNPESLKQNNNSLSNLIFI